MSRRSRVCNRATGFDSLITAHRWVGYQQETEATVSALSRVPWSAPSSSTAVGPHLSRSR
jgi:hypothetical protein